MLDTYKRFFYSRGSPTNQERNVNITKIEFHPCTGFGDVGRSACLYVDQKDIGIGYGATDDEAVAEALADAGLDAELVDAVMRAAVLIRF